MRSTLLVLTAGAALLATAACSRQAGDTPARNAEAVADQLEAKADNLEMMADESDNADAAIAMENESDVLDQESANLRATANPKQGEQ